MNKDFISWLLIQYLCFSYYAAEEDKAIIELMGQNCETGEGERYPFTENVYILSKYMYFL